MQEEEEYSKFGLGQRSGLLISSDGGTLADKGNDGSRETKN